MVLGALPFDFLPPEGEEVKKPVSYFERFKYYIYAGLGAICFILFLD